MHLSEKQHDRQAINPDGCLEWEHRREEAVMFVSVHMDKEGRVALGKWEVLGHQGNHAQAFFGQDLKEKEKEKQTGMVSVPEVLPEVPSSVRCYMRAVLLERINPSSP